MADPFRDDEIPTNYMHLRERGYGPSRQPQLPRFNDMMRGARRRVSGAADDVTSRAKALRRVLQSLLTGR